VLPDETGPATTIGPDVTVPPAPLVREEESPAESPSAVMPILAGSLRIGRAPDNDLVLDDLLVSRHHAELREKADGGYEITDLSSQNGTFVNGRRISTQPLTDSDTIGVGHSTFRLTGDRLEQFVDGGEVTVTAQELVTTVAGGKVLLPDPEIQAASVSPGPSNRVVRINLKQEHPVGRSWSESNGPRILVSGSVTAIDPVRHQLTLKLHGIELDGLRVSKHAVLICGPDELVY